MKATLLLPVALVLTACVRESPVAKKPVEPPALPTVATTKPVVVGIEPVAPTNIGDKSPIVFTSWHGIRKGSGTLSVDSKKTAIKVLNLGLEADGKFALVGQELSETGTRLAGSWRKLDPHTVGLSLNQIDGARATAEGSLKFMDQANPFEANIKGTDEKGKPVSLTFRVSE